jgi:hypothetical protein
MPDAPRVLFVSFYQPGNDLIRKAGFELYDPYEILNTRKFPLLSLTQMESDYKTLPMKGLLLHEKLTFSLKSDEEVLKKFSDWFGASEVIFDRIREKYNQTGVIVQELAGFVSPLALFYAGMKRGWTHYFLEPGYFSGRIHFDKNSLFCDIPRLQKSDPATEQIVRDYIAASLKLKTIVAPSKDAHHFRDMGVGKIVNLSNGKKLLKKLYYKYIKREKQEFEHIANHVKRYFVMFLNRRRNSGSYCQLSDLPSDKKFIYFPFHVQLDFALTVRAPDWLDQLILVEKAIAILPPDTLLIAKEHPASIGCLDQPRLEKLLQNEKFRLLHPAVNSHDLLARAHGVLTINSKVGAEALSHGLPVMAFGRSFYTGQEFTETFESWEQARAVLAEWVSLPRKEIRQDWISFLSGAWLDGRQIELYDLKTDNVDRFAQALLETLNSSR